MVMLVNWRIKSEGGGTRTIQYPVEFTMSKKLEMTSGVDMILYLHAPKAMNRSTGPISQIISDIKIISSETILYASEKVTKYLC